jgi:5'(3')-deoxyribonucleotidase
LKKQGHNLTVVTGRQIYATVAAESTINKHFHGIFDDIIYTNSYSLLGPESTKVEVCERIKADYLIDDSISQIESLEYSDTIPILFTGKPAVSLDV